MLDRFQRQDDFLQQVHPVLKLTGLLLVVIMMMFVTDPLTPLIMIVIAGLIIRLLGGIPLKTFMLVLAPFTLFAINFLWIQVVFPGERGTDIWFTIGKLSVAWENVRLGLSLGFRALVFVAWSLLFVLTTEPTKLMLGLVQHCRLPPRYGYGIMAAYRFLPLFRTELRQVRAAHRIRGLGQTGGMRGRLQQFNRYAIPLMASAIRKAERVAIAMESKGFDGSSQRTYYRHVRWTWQDVIYVTMLIAVLSYIMIVTKS